MNSIQQVESKDDYKGSQSKSSNKNKEIQEFTLKDVKKKSPSNTISGKDNSNNNKNNINHMVEQLMGNDKGYYSESDDDEWILF